jgi:hypothetical protein
MTKDLLTFWNYVKAAFHSRVEVPLLGRIPLNKLLLGGLAILGVANPGFWLLGIGLEAGYLLLMAGNERFQRVVQAGWMEQSTQTWAERRTRLLSGLDPESQRRYRRLLDSGAAVLRSTEHLPERGAGEDLRAGSLSHLHWMFLKLLASRGRIRETLAQTLRGDLEREIETLTGKMAKEDPGSPVVRSMQGTLDIQKRRLDNILQAESSLKLIEAELDRIEKHVALLQEESQVSSDPAKLSDSLDGVMESLQGTSKWMAENDELFGSLEEVSLPKTMIDWRLKEKS